MNELQLEDGSLILVKRLPLYALEDEGPQLLEDFTYKVVGGDGYEYEQAYPLEMHHALGTSEPGPEADEWEKLEWTRFQAALLHRQRQMDRYLERMTWIQKQVVLRAVPVEFQPFVITPRHYDQVEEAGLTPEVTLEVMAQELRGFFQSGLSGTRLLRRLAEPRKKRG